MNLHVFADDILLVLQEVLKGHQVESDPAREHIKNLALGKHRGKTKLVLQIDMPVDVKKSAGTATNKATLLKRAREYYARAKNLEMSREKYKQKVRELEEKLEDAFPENVRWKTRQQYGFSRRDMLIDFAKWLQQELLASQDWPRDFEVVADAYLGKKSK